MTNICNLWHIQNIEHPMKGKHHSEETKKKMSESHKGAIFSEEHRNNISLHRKGIVFSEEHKKKISESTRKVMLGRKVTWGDKISKARKGIKFSEEHLKNLSISHKGKKPINCHTPEAIKKRTKTRIEKDNYKHTAETKEKISKSLQGHIPSKETIIKLKLARRTQVRPFKDTSIEIKIQNFLKNLKIEYLPHKYMNISHGYQCDLFIPSKNLVIECDGDYWHNYPNGNERDHIRTKELKAKGFSVLRLWERNIRKMDIDTFCNIYENLELMEKSQ